MVTKKIHTLHNKDYCCIFCSHGETAEITETASTDVNISRQKRLKYAVTCSFCRAEYPIYDRIDRFHDISITQIIHDGVDIFKRYIEFSKGKEDFILVR